MIVRQSSSYLGPCTLLGELVEDTVVRFYYRRRCDDELAFVDKRSPMIHIAPCNACPDSQGEGAEGLALGNPERILRAVKRWESVGVDRINFLLNCMEEISQEQVLKSLRLFAREVMPHFQHPTIPAATPVGSAAQ